MSHYLTSVIERQLHHYNNHDTDGFVSTYSPDVEIYNLGETDPYITGHDALRERYGKRFEDPLLHAKVVNRMVIGNRVIDHENVTMSDKDEIVNAIAIYEVQEGLIRRVWFVR